MLTTLITKIEELEDIELRKKHSLILVLLPSILDAQKGGYSLNKIHEEINKKIPITFTTFKTTFYKVKKQVQSSVQK